MAMAIFLTTLSTTSGAAILSVATKGLSYALDLNKSGLSLKGNRHRLSLKRNPCNAPLLDHFEKNLQQLTKRLSAYKSTKGRYHYSLGDKKIFSSYKRPAEKALLLIPEEIRRIKLEEKYRQGTVCPAKKK